MKKIAVFIDRDGVINEEISFITKPAQIKIIEGAEEGIKMLNKKGILSIITCSSLKYSPANLYLSTRLIRPLAD